MGIRSWSYQQELVRKRLRDYRYLVSKYKSCRDLMDSLYPGSTQRMSDMPKGGGDDCKMESLIDRRTDLHCQMQESLKAMQDEIGAVISLIKPLPANEYTVVNRYFLMGESMDIVAEHAGISTRHGWRLHNQAICRLSEHVIDLQ